MFLISLVRALDRAKVAYAIAGGYAVNLHGVVRGTVDIDVVLQISLKDFLKAEVALTELGLASRLPVNAKDVFTFREEYIAKRNLIAWSFVNPNNPAELVDILINQDLSELKVKKVALGRQEIRIVALKDLIEMKRASGRPQDLEDVRALEKL